MAFTVGTVQAKVDADDRPFMSSMDKVRKAGADTARRIGDSFMNIGSKLTAGVTAPLLGGAGLALKTAAGYETLRQSMNALNGSVAEGSRQFERLKEFSAGTPFQLRDLADAQNMLQGFGLSADDAFMSMKQIGDIAAITGGSINDIGIAFGQAAAEGRLMTRDIRQLINQGVPAIKLLADTMGVAQSEVLDLASQGEISFQILQRAFQQATSDGGMFANGMARQAETLSGVWSTLKDNFSIALGEIGNSLQEAFDIKGLAKSLIANLKAFTKWFSTLSDSTKQWAFTIGALASALGPALVALGGLAKLLPILATGFAALTSPISLTVAAVGALAAAAAYVYDNWQAFRERFNQLWARIKNGVLNAIASMVDGLTSFLSYIPGVGNEIMGIGSAIRAMKDEVPEATTEFKGFGESMKSVFSDVTGWLTDAKEGMAGVANETTNVGVSAAIAREQIVRLREEMAKISPPKVSVDTTQVKEGLKSARVEGMTFSQVMQQGLWKAQEAANATAEAGARMGNALGQALSQAALHGRSLLGVLGNLVKQFASRVLMKGLSLLLSGGFSGVAGIGGVFSKIFGGIFHQGGIVPGSGEKLAMVKGGEGVFTPGQMRAMGSQGSQQIHITGEFRQRGTDLVATIDEVRYQKNR